MRLIDCEVDGAFTLTADLSRERIPAYAILSHTWGPEEDEIKYEHLTNGDFGYRKGWEKIWFCAQRARRDGLRYIWVDSCCIDKSSSAELTEAINSMFSWYKRAARCYVYLADVSAAEHPKGDQLENGSEVCMPAFRSSRWFTRSWTLQELLAPTSVEFFSREGILLGTRASLLQELHTITQVSIAALSGDDLGGVEVAERFGWAEHRQATREEDCAYSLMGILGVYMVPIYGEGKENAIRRLRREIDVLRRDSERQNGNAIVLSDTSSNYEPVILDLERVMMLVDESKVRAEDSRSKLLESVDMSTANDTQVTAAISSFVAFITTLLAALIFTSPMALVVRLDQHLDRRIGAGEQAIMSSQDITSTLHDEECSTKDMIEKLERARDRLEGGVERDGGRLRENQNDKESLEGEADSGRLQSQGKDLQQSIDHLGSTREEVNNQLSMIQKAQEDMQARLAELKALRSEEEQKLSKLRKELDEITRQRIEWENKTAWGKIKGWISWLFGQNS